MANTPNVRFKGFTDDWKQRKLGEVCSEIGDGLHSAPFYDENGEYFFINGNNLVNGKIVINLTETKKVSEETFEKNNKYLDDSTILLSINGTIGNLAYYAGEKAMLGKSAAYLKVKNIDKTFLYASLQTSIIMNGFKLSLTGTTIKNLGLEAIKNTRISIPNDKEQVQIGAYFATLDQLITFHQHKCDEVKQLKKFMLQKMFPKSGELIPEIRFVGFADAWERRKLGEVVSEFKSGVSLKADEIEAKGAYPVYGGNGLRGYTSTYNHDGEFALIGRQGALCGNMNYSVGKAYFTEHAVAVQADENNDTRFIYYLLDTMRLGQYSDQSAQPGLAVNKLIKLENMFPDKSEQVKISTYFAKLDHLITLHQRKCDELKEVKRFMLQNMFPQKG